MIGSQSIVKNLLISLWSNSSQLMRHLGICLNFQTSLLILKGSNKLWLSSLAIDSIQVMSTICGETLEEERTKWIASNSRDFMVTFGAQSKMT